MVKEGAYPGEAKVQTAVNDYWRLGFLVRERGPGFGECRIELRAKGKEERCAEVVLRSNGVDNLNRISVVSDDWAEGGPQHSCSMIFVSLFIYSRPLPTRYQFVQKRASL